MAPAISLGRGLNFVRLVRVARLAKRPAILKAVIAAIFAGHVVVILRRLSAHSNLAGTISAKTLVALECRQFGARGELLAGGHAAFSYGFGSLHWTP